MNSSHEFNAPEYAFEMADFDHEDDKDGYNIESGYTTQTSQKFDVKGTSRQSKLKRNLIYISFGLVVLITVIVLLVVAISGRKEDSPSGFEEVRLLSPPDPPPIPAPPPPPIWVQYRQQIINNKTKTDYPCSRIDC